VSIVAVTDGGHHGDNVVQVCPECGPSTRSCAVVIGWGSICGVWNFISRKAGACSKQPNRDKRRCEQTTTDARHVKWAWDHTDSLNASSDHPEVRKITTS